MNSPVVRAVDVGYGHVKYTEGRNQRGAIVASSFPSQSIAAPKSGSLEIGALLKMDTVIVPLNDGIHDARLVVGKGIAQPMARLFLYFVTYLHSTKIWNILCRPCAKTPIPNAS